MLQLKHDDVLVIIDMQNDFCPGGALAVAGGDQIVPLINQLSARFPHVILTQDWHPAGHISHASAHPGSAPYQIVETSYGEQSLWPDHCLQGTPGADFHPGLDLARAELILRKGFRPGIDSYSAFLENDHETPTGLSGYLWERKLQRLFFCGLAYDFCVRYSAIDGRAADFDCFVLEDATRAVNLPGNVLPGSVEQANAALAETGIPRILSSSLAWPQPAPSR